MADFPKIEGMESKTRQALEITLSWPDAALSPNSREHWATVYKAKKKAKEDAYYMTLSYSFGDWLPPDEIAITYTFYPPTNHERDDDNFITRMKPARDGIAECLGMDDKHFHTQPVEWGDVCKPGKVVVRLEEMNND